MKDFLLRELVIDDIIVFDGPNGSGLVLGKVVGFTPKQVRISAMSKNYSWNSDGKLTRYPSECVKVDEEDVTMYMLVRDPKLAA